MSGRQGGAALTATGARSLKAGMEACGPKRSERVGMKGSDTRKLLLADGLWRRTVLSQE